MDKAYCDRTTVMVTVRFTLLARVERGWVEVKWWSVLLNVGSVFVRDSTECRLLVACQQFRIRDCTQLDISLFCITKPIIESSTTVRLACYQYSYPQLAGTFSLSSLRFCEFFKLILWVVFLWLFNDTAVSSLLSCCCCSIARLRT